VTDYASKSGATFSGGKEKPSDGGGQAAKDSKPSPKKEASAPSKAKTEA
jgi:hypothetical protein